jgi:hypothetical protein
MENTPQTHTADLPALVAAFQQYCNLGAFAHFHMANVIKPNANAIPSLQGFLVYSCGRFYVTPRDLDMAVAGTLPADGI